MLLPDSVLQNRYRVVRQLGAGGMGAIYEAIDQRVSCVVVIKETLVGPNSDARQAFQREAALLANLRHACLPKVMDYFGEANGEFLVMEFIPGNDLAELLEQQPGPFPVEQVLNWADQLLNLLDYLHTREPAIVHRDIKPANLKLTNDGEIFLLDFGLAKGAAGQMATVKADGSIYGYTPLYAPLEQIHGQGTDPRTDIYSLGATLYDLLAGQPPVSAPVRFESTENERPDPLPLLNKLNFKVHPGVAEVIQKAMAMNRRNRFQSAAEMRAALEHARTAAEAENFLDDDSPEVDPDRPIVSDDNVQFTVYTPRRIKPKKTYTMLAFAHLSKKRDDAPEDEPDPIAAMKDQAARILGNQQADYDDTQDEGSQPVPREGELMFVPLAKGITFSPPSRTFTWRKSVHREEFDLWTASDLDGQTVSGTLTVFLGSLVIASVPLKISIDSRSEPAAEKISLDTPQTGRRVRQIYASYSPQDERIVKELAQVAPIFGSRFVMDRTHLEPGEDRREGLHRLIRGADVFQLFWSTNSMRSADTADELEYATSLSRPGFILPTYWEEPLPKDPAAGLPPPEIARLQFHRIYPGAFSSSTAEQKKSRLVFLAPAGSEVFLNDERLGSMGKSGRLVVSSIPAGQHVLRIVSSGYRDDERVIEVREGGEEQTFLGRFKTRDRISGSAMAASPIIASAEPERPTAQLTVPDERQNTIPTGELPRIEADRDTAPLAAPPEMLAPPPTQPVRDTIAAYDRRTPTLSPAPPSQPQSAPTTYASAPSQSQVVIPEVSFTPAKYGAPPVARSRRNILLPIFAGVAMVLFVVTVVPIWYLTSRQTSSGSLATAPLNSNTNSSRNLNTNSTANANTSSPRKPGVSGAAGIQLVYIPAGSFLMGSETGKDTEKPVRQITIRQGFYLGMYEVTQAQWQTVMGSNPSKYSACGGDCPVNTISWDEAHSFLNKLNEFGDRFKYRLPSEAEWEYACRAGTAGEYSGTLKDIAWYAENSGDVIHPVGGRQTNAWGLADMLGNVWEYCEDAFMDRYPSSPTDGSAYGGDRVIYRVIRGGSFNEDDPTRLRCASRGSATGGDRWSSTGLRVVAVPRNQ